MRASACTVAALVVLGLSAVPSEARAQGPRHAAQLVAVSTTQPRLVDRTLKGRCRLPMLICASGVLIRGAGHVGGAVIGTIGGAAGDAVGAGASAIMSAVVSWAAEGAAWLMQAGRRAGWPIHATGARQLVVPASLRRHGAARDRDRRRSSCFSLSGRRLRPRTPAA